MEENEKYRLIPMEENGRVGKQNNMTSMMMMMMMNEIINQSIDY